VPFPLGPCRHHNGAHGVTASPDQAKLTQSAHKRPTDTAVLQENPEGLSSPVPPGKQKFSPLCCRGLKPALCQEGGRGSPDSRKMYPGCFKPVLRRSPAGPRQPKNKQQYCQGRTRLRTNNGAENKSCSLGPTRAAKLKNVDPSATCPAVREVRNWPKA
jgi:hypothetical protein